MVICNYFEGDSVHFVTHQCLRKLLPEGVPLFFLRMFGLRAGWVGQQKSEHCLDLEIGTKKLTLPKNDAK